MTVFYRKNSRFILKKVDASYSILVLVFIFVCVTLFTFTKVCIVEKSTGFSFRLLQGLRKSSSYGVGHVEEFGGLKCYVAGRDNSKTAVILISDVYGYETPHLRMIADKVAAASAEFYVLVPDFFNGDPYVANNPQRNLTVWKNNHPPLRGFEDAKPLIDALRTKGIVKYGAAGFCWGGKVAVELAKSKKYIDAAVLSHPSDVTVDDMEKVKVPISVLGAELDGKLPPSLMREFEAALKENSEVDNSFVKIYPGLMHGWTLKYNDTDGTAVKNANEAHKDMLNWFLKHLNRVSM